ncbi:MAG: NADP-dependent phosphogluconate dehydrogenase [Candidatus Peribacteraceae bacterium]|nr:NADP-dependent phosphogluconate dehydrogenase [Candidatus Peribacteraceae bacterium]
MQLGVIGLGTMGANLARNAARNGARVVLFNRTTEKTQEFIEKFKAEGEFVPTESLRQFVSEMTSPRAILLMVKAGDAVDAVIEELLPMLTKGDILIDAGNSHFNHTERREARLKKMGIHFVGMGVSGGEEGALLGPSMMPGGDPDALKTIMPLLMKMAAPDGAKGKCVTHIGPGGAGHFVKMVHNGIEYGIMQLIAESYDLLKTAGKMKNADLAKLFTEWSTSDDLGSFLMEITAQIFKKKDPDTKKDLIDVIADVAGQKGTGKWTTETAMDLGIAIPTINAAVDARILSGEVEHRARRMKELPESLPKTAKIPTAELISMVRSALELSIICTYAQGFELMAKMSGDKKWNLDLAEVARIWRGGCIIRSHFLTILQPAQTGNVAAEKAVLKRMEGKRQSEWREMIGQAVSTGVPVPAMSASLWFYDTLRRERLPQNLIQAQRDYFGAHTYQRVDKKGAFHTDWNAIEN